jgi:nucleoside-diphosphate-sugar epimerase
MRILVIGGTHFIGPHVVARLHGLGHEITVYHRGLHEADLPPDVRHVHDPGATVPITHFSPCLTEPAPDVVLHMHPIGAEDTAAAVARFAGVARRIVGLSSGDVYRAYGRLLGSEPGPPEPAPLNEDSPLRNTHFPYRQSAAGPGDWTYHYEKILVEQALLKGSLPATVLRLPAVYGPGDPHRRLRPFLRRMLDQRPAIILEANHARWRWTHGYVEDVAFAIALAATDERAIGKVYNLGEAATPSTRERLNRIGRVAGWRGGVVTLSRDQLPAHLRQPYEPKQDLVMDSRRIRNELGFAEYLSEDEGLRRTMEWERGNPSTAGDPTAEEYAEEDAVVG